MLRRLPKSRLGRPRGGSSAAIVRRIMKATLKQLGDEGFAALSVDEVARAAGVNKTSVYRRWPSKGALVLAADADAGFLAEPILAPIYHRILFLNERVDRGYIERVVDQSHPLVVRQRICTMRLSMTLAALGLAALSLAGCDQTKARPPPPIPTVTVEPVVTRDVPLYLEAVATLDGYVNAEIRARVRGYLQAQGYKDGAAVKQGQVMFTIERSEYLAAVSVAKAALARARTLQSHNRLTLSRKQALVRTGVASKQELDDAEAGNLDADSQAESAQAQLGQAQLNLSYTVVRSPVSGVAGLPLVRVGNLVGQDGPTLLTTVSQIDPMRINFPISEVDYVKSPDRFSHLDGRDLAWARKQFKKLKAAGSADGDPGLDLVLADGSSYPHHGVIVARNRQVDPSTGTIQVQALFPNPDGFLRPGQFGRVRLRRQDAGSHSLVVSEKALIQVQGTYSLAVVGADNKVQQRKVEVGPASGDLRIINSGVTGGERVVIEGLQQARDGAVVNPKLLAAPAAASTGRQ